jgi:hypothetical protein
MDPASERLAGTAFGRFQVLPDRREVLADSRPVNSRIGGSIRSRHRCGSGAPTAVPLQSDLSLAKAPISSHRHLRSEALVSDVEMANRPQHRTGCLHPCCMLSHAAFESSPYRLSVGSPNRLATSTSNRAPTKIAWVTLPLGALAFAWSGWDMNSKNGLINMPGATAKP